MSENKHNNMQMSRERTLSSKNADRCARCALPINWGITRLDDSGVCNYCRFYDTAREKLRDFDRWNQLFLNHIEQHRGKFEYDAVVGFSGGKDSSYIVHTLKEHYKCRVLAVTVDFGFMPTGPAKENIKRVADHLGIDHINYEIPSDYVRRSFRGAIKKGRLLCGFCTTLCWAIPRKIAIERHIPLYIIGSDRGQMFRELSPETAPVSGSRLIDMMLTPYSEEKTLRFDNPKIVNRWRSMLGSFGLPAEFCEEIYPFPESLPGTKAVPLSLQFFLFHAYCEKEIKRILASETGWHLPPDDHLHAHHDCVLHDAAMYFVREAVGTTLTTGEICVDVREGEIRREEAVKVLEDEEKYLGGLKEPYKVFQEYFGISEKDVRLSLKRFRRRFTILRLLRKFQMIFSKPKLRLLDDNK